MLSSILIYLNDKTKQQLYTAQLQNHFIQAMNNHMIFSNKLIENIKLIYQSTDRSVSSLNNFNLQELDVDNLSWNDISNMVNQFDILTNNQLNNAQINVLENSNSINTELYNIQSINNELTNTDSDSNELVNEKSTDSESTNIKSIDVNSSNTSLTNEQLIKISNLLDNSSNNELSNTTFNKIDTTTTPYMHTFNNGATYNAFISDFFPLTDSEISVLIKSVRLSIKNNEHTSAIDIYKYWINTLKNNNDEYHKYNFNNFDDNGQYLGNISQNDTFDIYINHIEDVITYDEAEALRKQKKADLEAAEVLLRSGTYYSDIDPDLNTYFK